MYTFEVSYKLEGDKCRVVVKLAEPLPMWLFNASKRGLERHVRNFSMGMSQDWTTDSVSLNWRGTFEDWDTATNWTETILETITEALAAELARQSGLEQSKPEDFTRRYALAQRAELVPVE